MKATDKRKVFFDKEIKKNIFNRKFVLHFSIERDQDKGNQTEPQDGNQKEYSDYYRGMTRWQTL